MRGWAAEIAWLLGALVLGALLGALLGQVLGGAFLALLAFTLWRLRDLARLEAWVGHTIARPPRLAGVVEDVGYRLWRQRRAGRARTRRLASILRDLQRATHALPDAAVLLDGAGDIVWFNHAGVHLLGLQSRDVGRSMSGLLRAPEIQRLLDERGAAPEPAREDREREADDGGVEMVSPADERITLDVRVVAYSDDRRLLLARDISQVAQLRTMRQDFIANVSHELRTPLTVVIGYLEALDGDTDAALTQRTLERLRRPAARMKSLVEDLLLLSRLDTSGPPEVEDLGLVDVSAMLRRICADVGALTDAEHEVDLALTEGLLLRGLDVELHSAFGNVIVNAVRYSPDGGKVRVAWYPDGDGAVFSVQDQGLGVAEEHLARLTERFYRVDVGRSRDAGGTGLGLAIVKHVLRRHGSELEVASVLGEGSTFSCRFGPGHVVRSERVSHRERGHERGQDRGHETVTSG